MKQLRISAVLLVIFAVLVGLSVWDEKKTEQESAANDQESSFFDFDDSNVVEVTLFNRGAAKDRPITIRKSQEGDWKIVAPIEVDADTMAVTNLIENVRTYRYEKRVERGDRGLADYGLETPKFEVQIKTGDEVLHSLKIGSNAPIGYSLYVQADRREGVYLASQFMKNALSKSLFDFRDKGLHPLELSDVERFDFRTKAGLAIRAQKQDDLWRMEADHPTRADEDTLQQLWSQLNSLRVTEFIDQPSEKLQQVLSLDQPQAEQNLIGEIRLEPGIEAETPGPQSWWIKVYQNDEQYYGQSSAARGLVRFDESVMKLFDYKSFDFRYKDVFAFDANAVTKVSIDSTAYIKVDKSWYEEPRSPNAEPLDRLRSLLIDLEFAKADMVVRRDESPIDIATAPQHRLEIWLGDHQSLEVKLFPVPGESSYWVLKSGDADIYRVEQDVFEHLTDAKKTATAPTDESRATQ